MAGETFPAALQRVLVAAGPAGLVAGAIGNAHLGVPRAGLALRAAIARVPGVRQVAAPGDARFVWGSVD
jgi:hypothetical protein